MTNRIDSAAAITLFDEYISAMTFSEDATSSVNDDLLKEVQERLKQLHFILENFYHAVASVKTMVVVSSVNEAGETIYHNPNVEYEQLQFFFMRLLTESFYYFSFRIRQVLRNRVHPMPHLGSFECPGVRDVRNHLIEHPEGSTSRIFTQSYVFTPDSGMHLKTNRREGESTTAFVDSGLCANAEEFMNNFCQTVTNALISIKSNR